MITAADVKKTLGGIVPSSGGNDFFCVDDDSWRWRNCRETFANDWNAYPPGGLPTSLYYCYGNSAITQISDFITRTEEVLDIPRSDFASTIANHILWVRPSAFWRKCSMRGSLFTALLKSAKQYKNDFEMALFSCSYLAETNNAVMRFLFGFTTFNVDEAIRITNLQLNEGKNGWWNVFRGRCNEEIRFMLIGGKTSPIGGVALWA